MLKIYAATTTRYVGSTLPLEVRALNCSNASGMYAEYICSSITTEPVSCKCLP